MQNRRSVPRMRTTQTVIHPATQEAIRGVSSTSADMPQIMVATPRPPATQQQLQTQHHAFSKKLQNGPRQPAAATLQMHIHQTAHVTPAMLRQHHQHVNSNNNNNNNNTSQKNFQPIYHQHEQLPKHQQLHLHQQQQHMTTHQRNHPQQQQQQWSTTAAQQHQTRQYYDNRTLRQFNTRKFRATNNNSNNEVAPKIILQNPNRILNPTNATTSAENGALPVVTTSAPKTVSPTATKQPTNLDSKQATPVVSANVALHCTNDDSIKSVKTESSINASATSAGQTDTPTEALATEADGACANENETTVDSLLSNEDSSMKSRNSKEKTPMCLVNELARHNKITHQYRLTNEKGPAHSKCFTVTLKLGDEEYSAVGYKIKKAQHLAASEALEKTKYKHPPAKSNGRSNECGLLRSNITPTVELNALAMKLGHQTNYIYESPYMSPQPGCAPSVPNNDGQAIAAYNTTVPTQQHPPHLGGLHMSRVPFNPNFTRRIPMTSMQPFRFPRNMPVGPAPIVSNCYAMPKYQQTRFPMYTMPPQNGLPPPPQPPLPPHHAHMPFPALPITPYKVTLMVGKDKFTGIGRTLQQAKHDAASCALQLLKTQKSANELGENSDESLEENDSKSPISLVHEIASKRNMSVHFKVLREEGPAHMRNFITECIVGSIVTEGEGNGKKISKKRSAEKMLVELLKLPPLTPTKSLVASNKPRSPNKPKASTHINSPGAASSSAGRVNKVSAATGERRGWRAANPLNTSDSVDDPITKLIQLQQTRKDKEPIFEIINKKGNENTRRREFIIEVTAQGMVARGMGANKKLAKRNAAQNLLDMLNVEAGNVAANSQTATKNLISDNQSETVSPVETDSCPQAENSCVAAAVSTTTTMPTITSPPSKVIGMETGDLPLTSNATTQECGILISRQNRKSAGKKKESNAFVNHTNLTTILSEPTNAESATEVIENQTIVSVSALPTPLVELKSNHIIEQNLNTSKSVSTSCTAATASAATETADINNASASSSSARKSNISSHMKDQLLYLAKLMGFEVSFSDFPKGNHNEYLTIVSLTSNPPQICHGVGSNMEESQNDAAKNALKLLSELGLNSAKKT